MNYTEQPLPIKDALKGWDWWLTHTRINNIFHTLCICVWFVGSLCSSVGSCLPRETSQSQHSLGIGLSSWRVLFPQQDKQRPSSDRTWDARHNVQLHMPGPRQSMQDESHGLQFDSSLSDSEPCKAAEEFECHSHKCVSKYCSTAYRAALPICSYSSNMA